MTLIYAEIQARAEQLRDTLRARRFEREFERNLTDQQRHERAVFLARMRANRLRPPPSIFGEL